MNTYTFTLILETQPEEVNTALSDALFEAGCSDALLHTSEGTVYLTFDREAFSPVEAVASAIAQVENAGIRVFGHHAPTEKKQE